jgi:monoamine oxidase
MFSVPAIADGPIVELGAEWIDTHHRRMRAFVQRFGLTLAPPTMFNAGHQQLFRHGVLRDLTTEVRVEVERFWDVLTELGVDMADAADPLAHPMARQLDEQSLRDLFDSMSLSDDAMLLLRRLSQGLFGAEPADVSLLYAVQQHVADIQEGSDDYGQRLDGGMSRIAVALADSLGAIVRYDHQVIRIDTSTPMVDVSTSSGVMRARCVVVATALGALRHMDSVPALPDAVARAIAEINIGPIVKTPMVIERWDDERWLTTDGSAQRWYRHNPHRAHDAPVVMTYTGGSDALDRIGATDDEQVRWSAEQLTEAHGVIGSQVIGGRSQNWASDPSYGGAYSAFGPGQLTAHWATVRTPVGPLHLAGEYTSIFGGYMEGAAESGERAARWAIDRLNASATGN